MHTHTHSPTRTVKETNKIGKQEKQMLMYIFLLLKARPYKCSSDAYTCVLNPPQSVCTTLLAHIEEWMSGVVCKCCVHTQHHRYTQSPAEGPKNKMQKEEENEEAKVNAKYCITL